MRRQGRRALVGLAVAASLAMGVAACGDDEGDTGTGPDESALAQFCQSLGDFDESLTQAEALTPDSSQAEITAANEAVGGEGDSVGLAAQGAGIDVSALTQAIDETDAAVQAVQGDPTRENLEALLVEIGQVEPVVQELESANCAGEATTTA